MTSVILSGYDNECTSSLLERFCPYIGTSEDQRLVIPQEATTAPVHDTVTVICWCHSILE